MVFLPRFQIFYSISRSEWLSNESRTGVQAILRPFAEVTFPALRWETLAFPAIGYCTFPTTSPSHSTFKVLE